MGPFVYALKKDDAYYVVYLEDADYFYMENIFPEVSGIRTIRVRKDDVGEVVKIKTTYSQDGKLEYIHPEQ